MKGSLPLRGKIILASSLSCTFEILSKSKQTGLFVSRLIFFSQLKRIGITARILSDSRRVTMKRANNTFFVATGPLAHPPCTFSGVFETGRRTACRLHQSAQLSLFFYSLLLPPHSSIRFRPSRSFSSCFHCNSSGFGQVQLGVADGTSTAFTANQPRLASLPTFIGPTEFLQAAIVRNIFPPSPQMAMPYTCKRRSVSKKFLASPNIYRSACSKVSRMPTKSSLSMEPSQCVKAPRSRWR